MKILAAMAVVALATIAPATTKAAPAAECVGSWKAFSAKLDAAKATVAELPAGLRANVEANYNGVEPKTDVRLTHAFLARLPDGAMALFLVSGEDCDEALIPVNADILEKLTAAPEGDGT